jgi:flagellar hook-basal body protein
MSYALSSGVTGLQAHQKMLDVAGNNLANVNTTAFKASTITFSELLGETLQQASQPTDRIGGTNPQQMGSGVGVAGISANMAQGNIVNTGNSLDVAIEGAGYFVVSDGQQSLYTRAGTYGVDEAGYLGRSATDYRVQRGTGGGGRRFQIPGSSNIRVPYDVLWRPSDYGDRRQRQPNAEATALATAQLLMASSKITVGDADSTATTQIRSARSILSAVRAPAANRAPLRP